jgi:hypothetical protein
MEKIMKDLRPLYTQKALDQIAGPLKNASRQQNGSLLIGTKLDDQSKELLK